MSFYYPARFQMNVPGSETATGPIIMPSGIPSHTLTRRNLGQRRRLLDPQLYLGELLPSRCPKACTCLVSYPWFMSDGVASYDSGRQTQAQWRAATQHNIAGFWRPTPTDSPEIERAIVTCVDFQVALGVEAIILPSPLTRDHATDYNRELEWLETGLAVARSRAATLPALATVAISDTCLRGFRSDQNSLLEIILDQITARAPHGVYIVIEQANESTYNCTSENTVGSLLRLVSGMRAGGLQRVIVSFAGTAGLLCLLAGADSWATGWYRGERRLKLVDFEQQEGRAIPAYYSHPAATEFHLATDLSRVASAGLLDRIADETDASATLLRALRDGRAPKDVAQWAPRQGNVQAARIHFMKSMIRETHRVESLDEAGKIRYGRSWLDNAATLASELYTIGSFNPRTELDHQLPWRSAFGRAVS